MKVTVKLLKPYSDIAGKDTVILEFEEGDVNAALNALCDHHPALKKELYNDKGEVDFTINIFINDKPMSSLDSEATKLKDKDELLIFMPVGGG